MCYGFYWSFLNEKTLEQFKEELNTKDKEITAIEANNTEQGVSLCCRNKNK